MQSKPTIKDVAKLAGVSFKSVSRVINNEPTVGDELKAKVWKAIKTLNYHPNLSARQMRGSSSFIGFIYDNPNSHYIIDMQNGILEECRNMGYELVIHPCDASSDDILEELIEVVKRTQLAGLILTPPLSESDLLTKQLHQNNIRTVRILSASESPSDDPDCICVNDRAAALAITEHLIEQGHTDIAFLSGDENHDSTKERYAGYLEALAKHNISVKPNLVITGQYSFESGVERTQTLLMQQQVPTAVFACNDEIAAGTLFAARLAGIEIPAQLAIVGFENSPFSRQTWPKLSTAMQPNAKIAANATRLLLATIRNQQADFSASEKVFLPQLIVRESSLKPSE